MLADPYASGVLVKEVHERLVADLDNYARDASIQKTWIYKPLAETCGGDEIEWVKRFKFHTQNGMSGLCLLSKYPTSIEDRMAAIAGALVRNFVRAKMMTLGQVMDDLDSAMEASCLLIPNFFIAKALGGHQSPWNVSAIYDMLVARHAAGVQTVIYVSDMGALGTDYGVAIKSHIEAHFVESVV